MNTAFRARLLAVLLAAGAGAAADLEAQQPERRAREMASRRGWLGFSYEAPAGGRLVVMDVLPASPAERAGLQEQDTVVRWNGRADVAEAAMENALQPGDTVRLRVRRGEGRDREVVVVAGERSRDVVVRRPGRDGDVIVIRPGPVMEELRVHLDSMAVHADSMHRRLRIMLRDSLGPRLRELEEVELPRIRVEVDRAMAAAPFAFGFGVGARSVAGAEFAEINEGLSEYFDAERGVVVLQVAPETPAARAGLEPGDVVVRANGFAVERIGQLRQAVSRAEGREVELQVLRKGRRRTVQMRWE